MRLVLLDRKMVPLLMAAWLASTAGVSSEEPNFVPLGGEVTGLALEAYALRELDKDIDEDFSLRWHSNLHRLDEFERRGKREEYLALIREKLEDAAQSIAGAYFVQGGAVVFGEYDFDGNFLPIVRYPAGNLNRDYAESMAWSIRSEEWGLDTITNYRPPEDVERAGLGPQLEGALHFDWSPVLVNYAFSDPEQAKEFVDTYAPLGFGQDVRATNVRLISTLDRVERSDNGFRNFHFTVECMMFLKEVDGRWRWQGIAAPSGSIEPCAVFFENFVSEPFPSLLYHGDLPFELSFGRGKRHGAPE